MISGNGGDRKTVWFETLGGFVVDILIVIAVLIVVLMISFSAKGEEKPCQCPPPPHLACSYTGENKFISPYWEFSVDGKPKGRFFERKDCLKALDKFAKSEKKLSKSPPK